MPNEAQTYGGPQVRTAPLAAPLVNPGIASADAFGASIADGALHAERGVFNAYNANKEKERVEKEKVADTKAMDAYLKLSEADGKLSSQSRLKTGANAKGLPDSYNTAYSKLVNDQSERLKDDPEAQEVFANMAERRRVSSVTDIQRHSDSELMKFQTDTWEAGQIQARQDALSGVITLDQSLAQQRGNRQRLADINGMPQAEADLLWQADKDKTVGGAIAQRQKLGDIAGAQQTLEKYGHELSPELRATIQGDLKTAGEAAKAQTYAKVIMDDPKQTRSKAYQQLKMVDDPELRERTRINIEREFAQREAVKSEAQGSTFESMADAIEAGESYDSLIAKNPLAAGLLDERQTASLRRVEQDAINRREPEEWGEEYAKARNAASQFPDDFAGQDLRLLKGTVRKSEYEDLNERQQAIKAMQSKSDTGGSKVVRGILSADDVAKNTLREMGVTPEPVRGVVDPQATAFNKLFDRALIANGGASNLNSQQMQDIADKIVLKVAVPDKAGTTGKVLRIGTFGAAGLLGIGVDGTKQVRTMDLPNADKMAFSADQIPRDKWAASMSALVKAGISDPTPDEILEHYNGHLSNEGK